MCGRVYTGTMCAMCNLFVCVIDCGTNSVKCLGWSGVECNQFFLFPRVAEAVGSIASLESDKG